MRRSLNRMHILHGGQKRQKTHKMQSGVHSLVQLNSCSIVMVVSCHDQHAAHHSDATNNETQNASAKSKKLWEARMHVIHELCHVRGLPQELPLQFIYLRDESAGTDSLLSTLQHMSLCSLANDLKG